MSVPLTQALGPNLAMRYNGPDLEVPMNFSIEFEREADGRWLAEIPELPGVLAYGATADEAMGKAEILALRVLAERIENGEIRPIDLTISVPAAA